MSDDSQKAQGEKPAKDRDTFRFQMKESDKALVAQAANKVGDVSAQAFAHRAIMQEARRVLSEPDPADIRRMEIAIGALRATTLKKKGGPSSDIA